MASQNIKSGKRRKLGSDPSRDTDSDSDAEVRKTIGAWPSWLIIQSADSERPITKLSPFAVAKGLKGLAGAEPKSVKRLRDGSLLVQVDRKVHSDNLLRSESLVNYPIQVSPHKSLNSSKGVIRCRELFGISEGEIKAELADQGVIEVRRATFRKGAERKPTNTLFLTFAKPTLPESIKVGYLRVRVALYVPSPLRCFKCQRFGHVKEKCPGEEVCATCSKAVHDGGCESTKCVNCDGDHPSFSRDCPVWRLESEIQRVKTEKKISFFEA